MSSYSRRQTLTGGAAVAATALLPAIPAQADDDAELFEAIARWRVVHDIYQIEYDRQQAILRQVDMEMPEYDTLMEACRKVGMATDYADRTPEQHRQVEAADDALSPVSEAYFQRAKELGYDENLTDDLLSPCNDTCDEAFAVPARTLAGLQAKLEMRLDQFPDDTFVEGDADLLMADIRRVAEGARS